MKKQLQILQILEYYDLPQILLASDNVGTYYLCLLVDIRENNTKYVATPISVLRLSGFLKGLVDLRNIFEKPEIDEWLIFYEVQDKIEAEILHYNIIPNSYLPDSGYFFTQKLETEEVIIDEALNRKNVIVHLAISDVLGNFSVDANTLGDVLKLYQSTLQYSYKKVLNKEYPKQRSFYYIPENYNLRAFASSNSSFNIHLYSTSFCDLFGKAIIELGLERFDELIRDFNNEEEYIITLRNLKGHAISSFKKLIKKLLDDNIKIKHKWFSVGQRQIRSTQIDAVKAEKIYEILTSKLDLTEETRVFVGYLVQVDVERGTWRILNSEDNKEYNGEAQGHILQGITVKTVQYRLLCTEIIEEFKVTEKEKTRFILQTIEQI